MNGGGRPNRDHASDGDRPRIFYALAGMVYQSGIPAHEPGWTRQPPPLTLLPSIHSAESDRALSKRV